MERPYASTVMLQNNYKYRIEAMSQYRRENRVRAMVEQSINKYPSEMFFRTLSVLFNEVNTSDLPFQFGTYFSMKTTKSSNYEIENVSQNKRYAIPFSTKLHEIKER